jgi:ABC-type transporter Mla MlaB component
MKNIEIILKNNKIEIIGFFDFDNIIDALNHYKLKTKDLDIIYINFENILKSNSCVFLFIINVIRLSIKNNNQVFFEKLPILLIEISKVYNLNKIIMKRVVN